MENIERCERSINIDNTTNYEYIKKMSVEDMAMFIRNIQINAYNNLPKEWMENEKFHCELLMNWLESWGFNG